MKRTTKWVVGAVASVAIAAGSVGIAVAGGDDSETPIPPGTALDQATAAALAHTGGGTVTATEIGDEESQYEVEVTLADGRQVDVQLDAAFNVVGDKTDAPGADEEVPGN